MTRVSFRLYSEDSPRDSGVAGPRSAVQVLRNSRRNSARFTDQEEVPMDNDNDTVGGYAVPVDPMDLLQCDSCQ